MFPFSVFTGLAYTDASKLKLTDLYPMGDGNIKLLLKRAKTDITTEMILPKQAVNIINRYKHTAEIEITGKVLPKRSNKEVNVQLKILANMVDIPIKLTTHIYKDCDKLAKQPEGQKKYCDSIKVHYKGNRNCSFGLADVFVGVFVCETFLPDFD